ncbi:DUF5711 family protein [uncultured Agathobaculum sp.]|uniref:DUF5711 family protein n=1 Tax=uncultured Agathobaculum sp. TaxID=2048140 RepID=UPI00320A3814
MSEQQPTKSKQNIIRFPSSRKERRRLLRESKDPRVRLTALLRSVCGWLLVICTALFLLSNYQLFTPTSIRSLAEYAVAGFKQHEGDITTINYENGTFSDAALFEAGIAYADNDSLFLARPGSVTTMKYTLGYSSPVVETSDDYVLVYDRGGMQAVLTNSATAVAELSLDSAIITGSIGQDGRFVLVTDEQGYRTAVAVYDTSGKEVFKYQSSEYYIVSADLSPDGKTLAALAFRQDGVALNSHVLFYDVSSGSLDADVTLEDTLGMALCYSGNTAAVLCDDGLYMIDRGGEAEHTLTVASSDLISLTAHDNTLAIATRSYSGARSDLYTVRSGTLSGPYALSEEPSALAISAAGTAVLSASGVTVYDTSFTPQWRNTEAVGARRVLMTDDGTVCALYTKNARLFTAHSEHSEEVTNVS